MIYLYNKFNNFKIIFTSSIFFLVVTLIIGPGIIVNYILKDNFGRARPKDIIEFHGTKNFTKIFMISNQCTKNCSFPSGHAAIGFYFTAFAYILNIIYFNRIGSWNFWQSWHCHDRSTDNYYKFCPR